MRNPFRKQEVREIPKRQSVPKKKGCKISFKKKGDEEIMEFSPECRPEQIEMARKMREERMERA